MSTKSKRRAARRTSQEETVAGEIMGSLLSAITFGALDAGEGEGPPSNVHRLTKRQSHVAARPTNVRTVPESRRVVG